MENILTEFRYFSSYILTLFIDNKSRIEVSKNPEHYGCIKYLDLWYYWLKNTVQDSLTTIVYILSCENVADLFTKVV